MAFDPAFYDLMQETITVEPFIEHDSYGRATYGPPATLDRVRVVQKITLLGEGRTGGPMGHVQQLVATHTVWAADRHPALRRHSRVTLASGETLLVLGLEVYPDETGEAHHSKAHLGIPQGVA